MKKLLLFLLCINIFIPYVHASTSSVYEYILMDMDSGRVLASKNKDSPRLIASITKIMTAILAIENKDVNEIVKVDESISKSYGSGIYISGGEEISLLDLLYGLMLRSGNDAALIIAKNIGGNVSNFVDMMNNKAQDLDMKNTTFINPHGLENNKGEGNISTAYDMALLMSYAIDNKNFLKIIGTKKYHCKTNESVQYIFCQ